MKHLLRWHTKLFTISTSTARLIRADGNHNPSFRILMSRKFEIQNCFCLTSIGKMPIFTWGNWPKSTLDNWKSFISLTLWISRPFWEQILTYSSIVVMLHAMFHNVITNSEFLWTSWFFAPRWYTGLVSTSQCSGTHSFHLHVFCIMTLYLMHIVDSWILTS